MSQSQQTPINSSANIGAKSSTPNSAAPVSHCTHVACFVVLCKRHCHARSGTFDGVVIACASNDECDNGDERRRYQRRATNTARLVVDRCCCCCRTAHLSSVSYVIISPRYCLHRSICFSIKHVDHVDVELGRRFVSTLVSLQRSIRYALCVQWCDCRSTAVASESGCATMPLRRRRATRSQSPPTPTTPLSSNNPIPPPITTDKGYLYFFFR
jgi:hypothetical protein